MSSAKILAGAALSAMTLALAAPAMAASDGSASPPSGALVTSPADDTDARISAFVNEGRAQAPARVDRDADDRDAFSGALVQTMGGAFAGPAALAAADDPDDRRIHGEAGAFIGTGGARGAYASTLIPIGKNSTLGLAVSDVRYGRR